MHIGNLYVRVRNDYQRESGCIILSVSMASGRGYFEQYHDPDTLEESFDAEDRERRRREHEALKDWVGTNGPEVCHAAIGRVWNEPCCQERVQMVYKLGEVQLKQRGGQYVVSIDGEPGTFTVYCDGVPLQEIQEIRLPELSPEDAGSFIKVTMEEK